MTTLCFNILVKTLIFTSPITNIYHKYPKFIIYLFKYITIYYNFINKLSDLVKYVLFTGSELAPLLNISAYTPHAWIVGF